MKRIVGIILTLILALGVTAGFTGCGKDDEPVESTPHTVSYLGSAKWVDENRNDMSPGNDNAGKTVYNMSAGENRFNPLKITQKFAADNALKHNLADRDLKDYKKLVIKAKGSGYLQLRIVSYPLLPSETNVDAVSLALTDTEQTFEFSFAYNRYEIITAGLKELRLVAAPGQLTYSGDIFISALEFSKDAPNPQLIVNAEASAVATPNVYDGSAKFDVNKNFAVHDPGTYTIKYKENENKVTVLPAKQEYSFIRIPLSGNMKDLKKLVITYKAKAGTSFKLKLEGGGIAAFETASPSNAADVAARGADPTCDGTEQTYTWDKFTAANLTDGAEIKLLIFCEPGKSVAEAYELIITKLEFQK